MSAVRSLQFAVLIVAAAAALLVPRSAHASKTQWSVFEDHTALVKSGDDDARDACSKEIQRRARRRHAAHRGEVERGRARARRQDEARLQRVRPARLRVRTRVLPRLVPVRRPRAAREQPRLRDHHDHHRRRAALGDRGRPRQHLRDRQPARDRERVRRSSRPPSRSATPASCPTCRPSTTSRSGTSPTTATSSSPPRRRPRSTATW